MKFSTFIPFLTFLVVFSSSITVSFAGTTGKIAGSVRDKERKQPLVGSNITIEGLKMGAMTDFNGDYYIINIPPGTYVVTASMIGYRKVTQREVRVRIDQTTQVDFILAEEALETEGVTITAERPKVELDRTASKEALTSEDIVKSWGTTVKDVIADISSTNANGGIRGSFGNDVAYKMDGLDLRDVGSNTNFSSLNLTTIQEVEVLTGGWNAEFGQANGAIINVVTRKATDRAHLIFNTRVRPAGKYHWGRNFYGDDDPFLTVMTTPNFWNPDSMWQTKWMDAPRRGYDGGTPYFKALGDTGRANWWKRFVNNHNLFPQMNYADHQEWEYEATTYGPLPMNGSGYLLSWRYLKGVTIYPSALKYNPEITVQGSIDVPITENTKVSFNSVFTKFTNSGAPRTAYQSSETMSSDVVGQQLPYLTDPYSSYRYWLFGNKGSSDPAFIRPPERAQMLNIQAKVTHVFTSKTFLEVALQHSKMKYNLDFQDVIRTAWFPSYGLPLPSDSLDGVPNMGKPPASFWDDTRWGYAGDTWRSWSNTKSYTLKADLTSQVTKHHLMKTGFLFSQQYFDKHSHEGGLAPDLTFAQVDDIVPIDNKPYEGAFYVQDKIEVGGMVVNAGLRGDFFNANKNVSSDIYDPLMISAAAHGGDTTKIGIVGYRQDGSGPGYHQTPTRFALSPRLGISHPITENTVLHFMYGVFNQRPAWDKILANPVVWTNKGIKNYTSSLEISPDSAVTYRYFGQKTGNPALTWEKMIQYEVGFEQNILDQLTLDVTMYYKDAHDLTSLGIDQGPASTQIQSSGANVDVRLYGDPYQPDGQTVGKNIRNFTTTVNGAWADVRGLEIKLDTRFKWINAEASYNISYLSTGSYHYNKMYKTFYTADGTPYQLGVNSYTGASNTDGGGVGLDDAAWNPHNSALLKLNVSSPDNYGINIVGFYPFENWSISTSTRWTQGQIYTWYPDDYTEMRTPNNRSWYDRWNTNMNLSKTIRTSASSKIRFTLQITNLFNQKHLRLLSGDALTTYLEAGTLPVHSTTKEPLEWSWYSNLPREINFSTMVEF